jgi:hypothetical protein
MSDQGKWRSTISLRTALTWLFAVDAGAAIAVGAAHVRRSVVIDDFLHGSATPSAIAGADHAVSVTSGLSFLALLATAAVLITWQWRSAKNNELLGRIRPRFTPGWSIGGWFIPFANLVIPVRIFHDLWQGSASENRNFRDWRDLRRWSVIGWWWAFWVSGNVLTLFINGGSTVTLEDYQRVDRIDATGSILTATAACFAIVVVRTITRRQELMQTEWLSRLVSDPGWYADPTARFDYRYWDGSGWSEHVAKAGRMATDQLA